MANWIPLCITLAIQAMVSMALLTLPVAATVIAQAMDVSAALTGVYITLVYTGATLASLAGGPAVARFGPIRVSQAGLLSCTVGLTLCAVPSLACMALGGVFIGLGYGPMTPASSHLLARTTPVHRMSLVFSVKQTGVPVGGVLAGAIVPGLLLWVGWQSTLLIVALANLLCAALAQPLRGELDADRQPDRPMVLASLAQPIRMMLTHRALVRLAAVSFVFSAVQVTLSTYLVIYLKVELSYSLVAAGLAMSATQIGGVSGRVLWGYVADRWLSARVMLAVLAALMTLCTATAAVVNGEVPVFWVTSLLVLFGASAIGWNGVYLAEVAKQAPPGMASMATAGTLAVTFVGVMIGPMLFGAVSGAGGSFRYGFAFLAIPSALTLLALLRSPK